MPSLARAAPEVLPQTPAPSAFPAGADEQIQGRPDLQQRLTVETMVNGQGPFRFVVDTGADRTVLAYDLAANLGLIKGEDVIVQGIGRSLPAPSVELKSLQIGSIMLTDVTAPVLPRGWLGADGYLGLDVIDGRRVVFDFLHHKMIVSPSGGSLSIWPNHNETIIKAHGDSGRLIAVNCSVDRVIAHAFVDSGAEISIGNTRLFAELQRVTGRAYMSEVGIPLIGVTGGSIMGRVCEVAEIKLGDLTYNRTLIAIADLDIFRAWGLQDKPAMFIGMNFLKLLSALTIDYQRKELRFKLAQTMLARA